VRALGQLGWFVRVRVLLLLPGHAHNLLDALFSHLQHAIRTCSITSIAAIADAIQHAFTAERLQPHLHAMLRSWDWRAFIGDLALPLAGQSVPLGFLIERVPGLPADVPARLLMQDVSGEPWLGLERGHDPVELLRKLPRGQMQRVPLDEVATDRDALNDGVRAARNHQLLHEDEAVELLRVIREGTLGVKLFEGSANKGFLVKPGSEPEQRVEVHVIDRPPETLQPPSAAGRPVLQPVRRSRLSHYFSSPAWPC
jgi:hypothetical protein